MFEGYDPLSSWQVRGILRLACPRLTFSSNKRSEERGILMYKIYIQKKHQIKTTVDACSASLEQYNNTLNYKCIMHLKKCHCLCFNILYLLARYHTHFHLDTMRLYGF